MNIRGLNSIGERWSQGAANGVANYEDGVRNPRSSWQRGALAAEGNYKTAVVAAAGAGKYGKGVTAAGDGAWQAGALDKGAGRFASGVSASVSKYVQNFSKFAQVIQSLSLPPRGPKGSPANLARVAVVSSALNKAANT